MKRLTITIPDNFYNFIVRFFPMSNISRLFRMFAIDYFKRLGYDMEKFES